MDLIYFNDKGCLVRSNLGWIFLMIVVIKSEISFGKANLYYANFMASNIDVGKTVTLGHKVHTYFSGFEKIGIQATHDHQVVEFHIIPKKKKLKIPKIYSKLANQSVFIFLGENIPAGLSMYERPEIFPQPIAIESSKKLCIKLELLNDHPLLVHLSTLSNYIKKRQITVMLSSRKAYTLSRHL